MAREVTFNSSRMDLSLETLHLEDIKLNKETFRKRLLVGS